METEFHKYEVFYLFFNHWCMHDSEVVSVLDGVQFL
jgi:hypothetical protein